MSEATVPITTFTTLPWTCQAQIFQYTPIIERVRLRRVCKTWRDNIDYCWRFIEGLSVIDRSPPPARIIFQNGGELLVNTRSIDLVNGLVDRCAPYMKSLTVNLSNINRELQLLAYTELRCRHLQSLTLSGKTLAHDSHIYIFLLTNPDVKSLTIRYVRGECYGFLNHLRLNTLEELHLSIESSEMSVKTLDTLEAKVVAFQLRMRKFICGIKNVLCRGTLKKFGINYASPEMLQLIGKQTELETLTITSSAMDDTVEFLSVDVLTKWHYLFHLGNLKEIRLVGIPFGRSVLDEQNPLNQLITDDIVEGLVQYCPLLEDIALFNWTQLTERSVRTLSTLQHLKSVKFCYLDHYCGITGESLTSFSSIEKLYLLGCKAVGDAGVMGLLRNCQTIQVLGLRSTGITNETLNVAIEETKKRTTGVKLLMMVGGSNANWSTVKNTSPLLKIEP